MIIEECGSEEGTVDSCIQFSLMGLSYADEFESW